LDNKTSRPPLTGWQRNLVLFVDRRILTLARRWLMLFNVLIGAYVLLPVLAPALLANGAPAIGRLIYILYGPACHQLPERSFFLFGSQATYTLDELRASDLPRDAGILERKQYLGNDRLGYKMAFCQRDTAFYGGLWVGGLIFGLVRKRLKPLPLLAFGLCLLPMAIDGGTQLVMMRESNWILRTFTGGLAGIASVWMLYPLLEEAFTEVRTQAQRQVNKA
jgi:uncharacterized membrane protein